MIRSALFVAVLGCMPIGTVFAHAVPVSSEPESGVVMEAMPARVAIRFSERIDAAASTITIYAPDGEKLPLPSAVVDPQNPRLFIKPLPASASASGTFTVSWATVSADDGHFSKGAFIFSVGHVTSASQDAGITEMIHRSPRPEAISLWIELLGAAMLEGSLLLAVWLLRPLRGSRPAAWKKFLARWTRWVCLGVFFLMTGVIAYLLLQMQTIMLRQSFDALTSFSMVMQTSAGGAALYRAACGLFFLVVFLSVRKRLFEQKGSGLFFLLWLPLLVFAALRASVSHAAASSFSPWLSVLMNVFHVLAKDGWIGASLALAVLVFPFLQSLDDPKESRQALIRYGKITSVLLAVGGVSGVYMTWLHVKTFDNLTTTLWGSRFVLLVMMATIFLAIRVYQQWVLDAERNPPKKQQPRAFWIVGEAAAGVCVLFLSSLMIITTPPLPLKPLLSLHETVHGTTVYFGEHPSDQTSFLLTFEDASGQPAMLRDAVVTATNDEKGIGPLQEVLTKRFEGGYSFPIRDIAAPGTWSVAVTGVMQTGYDATATFTFRVPKDLGMHVIEERRSWSGWFDVTMLSIAVIIVLGAIYLFLCSMRNGQEHRHANASLLQRLTARGYVWAMLPAFLGIAVTALLASRFQLSCTNNGHLWTESVPMSEGRVLSPKATVGCMVGMGKGLFHIADEREYDSFMRPAHVQLEMTMYPQYPQVGQQVMMRFTARDPEGGAAKDLIADHDRIAHVIIVNDEQTVFSHIHPGSGSVLAPELLEQAEFPVMYAFPKPGKYLVNINVAQRGHLFSRAFYIDVPGREEPVTLNEDLSVQKTFGSYDVTLAKPATIKAGAPVQLQYVITQNGVPVTDLRPYLAAPMHIAIVREDLRQFMHTHGMVPAPMVERIVDPSLASNPHVQMPASFGPDIGATITFPTAGLYTLFGEFRHGNTIVVTRFMVRVP